MIDEDATFEAFGYYARDLKPHSNKPIIAACDDCGKVRETTKNNYHSLCKSCANKGNRNPLYKKHPSEETRARLSVGLKGNTNTLGYKHTDEAKANMNGENNHNYNGGKKLARSRSQAKRKQQLGYTLLMPLAEGEAGHHVTNEYVVGVPAEVHQKLGGNRKKHRTKVLQWLKANDKKKYIKALCILAKEPLK